jgi:hypothetical protein
MSDSESDRRRELEDLRLASDLIQLATETLNSDLKAKTKARLRTRKSLCVRYAEVMRLAMIGWFRILAEGFAWAVT